MLTMLQFLFIVFCSYEITGVHFGTGRHVADIVEQGGSVPKAMQVSYTPPQYFVVSCLTSYIDVVDLRTSLRLDKHGH